MIQSELLTGSMSRIYVKNRHRSCCYRTQKSHIKTYTGTSHSQRRLRFTTFSRTTLGVNIRINFT